MLAKRVDLIDKRLEGEKEPSPYTVHPPSDGQVHPDRKQVTWPCD